MECYISSCSFKIMLFTLYRSIYIFYMQPKIHFPHLDIFPKVTLRPHQDEWREGDMFSDLWDPFLRNVLERGGTDHAEAQEEHICTGVTQRPQPVKLFLDEAKTGRHKAKENITSQSNVFRYTGYILAKN